MTSEQELRGLIALARQQGALVEIGRDEKAWQDEGRIVIETVRITGLPGIGTYPMSALTAAEGLRQLVGSLLPKAEWEALESARKCIASNVRKNFAQK